MWSKTKPAIGSLFKGYRNELLGDVEKEKEVPAHLLSMLRESQERVKKIREQEAQEKANVGKCGGTPDPNQR